MIRKEIPNREEIPIKKYNVTVRIHLEKRKFSIKRYLIVLSVIKGIDESIIKRIEFRKYLFTNHGIQDMEECSAVLKLFYNDIIMEIPKYNIEIKGFSLFFFGGMESLRKQLGIPKNFSDIQEIS